MISGIGGVVEGDNLWRYLFGKVERAFSMKTSGCVSCDDSCTGRDIFLEIESCRVP